MWETGTSIEIVTNICTSRAKSTEAINWQQPLDDNFDELLEVECGLASEKETPWATGLEHSPLGTLTSSYDKGPRIKHTLEKLQSFQ